MERAEIERAKHKPTESLDAYDYYLRAMWKFRQTSRSAIGEALPMFYKAIRRDPEFASAYAMAAWCHSLRKVNRWMTDPERRSQKARDWCAGPSELGQNDAVALARACMRCCIWSAISTGLASIDRAMVLDPNLARDGL